MLSNAFRNYWMLSYATRCFFILSNSPKIRIVIYCTKILFLDQIYSLEAKPIVTCINLSGSIFGFCNMPCFLASIMRSKEDFSLFSCFEQKRFPRWIWFTTTCCPAIWPGFTEIVLSFKLLHERNCPILNPKAQNRSKIWKFYHILL